MGHKGSRLGERWPRESSLRGLYCLYWHTGRRERWNLSLRKEPPSLEGRLLSPHGLMDKVGSNRAEPKLTA